MLRQAVFAEVDDEPDYVALGWSKAFEDLTAVDAAEYCVRFGMPTEDAPAVLRGAGVFWAAMEGNLPMLRYVVETLGADLWQCNTIGVTPLHMASRQGFNTVIRYIVARAGDSGSAELKACLDMQNPDPNPSPNPNPNPNQACCAALCPRAPAGSGPHHRPPHLTIHGSASAALLAHRGPR